MKKFKVGSKYSCRSVCDHNCIWTFRGARRTDKSVWLDDGSGNVDRFRIKHWDESETLKPLGSYSMAPILRAG